MYVVAFCFYILGLGVEVGNQSPHILTFILSGEIWMGSVKFDAEESSIFCLLFVCCYFCNLYKWKHKMLSLSVFTFLEWMWEIEALAF